MKIFILLLLAFTAYSQTVQTCKHVLPDMVTQLLPNYTGSVQPCSYSGFAPLDPNNVSALYYWYFPHQSSTPDSEVPLIVWLQGGPGTSSMFGLFLENGPFALSENSDGGFNVIYRDEDEGQSWTYFYNVLFVDQPIGVGFSYTTNFSLFPTDETQVSENLWTGLQYFLTLHPETRNLNWYIAGESFGGRYVPAIANYTLIANDLIANNTLQGLTINLKGVMIGDGLVNTMAQREAAVYSSFASSLIAPYQFDQTVTYSVNCQRYTSNNQSIALSFCNNLLYYVANVSGIDPYTISLPENITDGLTAPITPYLNTPQVYQALLVTNSPRTPGQLFNMTSANISLSLANDFLLGTSLFQIDYLVTRIKVLWYDGGFDARLGALGAYYWFPLLAPPYNKIVNTTRKIWTPNNNVAGFYTVFENLTYVIVNWAGHFVPYFQLETSVLMVETFTMLNGNWTAFQNISQTPVNITMCEYMNQCNGNGYCTQAGTCICNQGYGLADCSVQGQSLVNGNYTLAPRDYLFFTIQFALIDHIVQISGDQGLLEVYYTSTRGGPVVDPSESDLMLQAVPGFERTRSMYLHKSGKPFGYLTLHNTNYNNNVTFELKKDVGFGSMDYDIDRDLLEIIEY